MKQLFTLLFQQDLTTVTHMLPLFSISRLQVVQNTASRLLTGSHKPDQIRFLHWLPVQYQIDFKIVLLVYKALSNQAPK